MKNIKLLSLLLVGLVFLIACSDDDEPQSTQFEYHAHIMSPDTTDKHMNDTLAISVHFESHTGEAIHHVNVRIYDLDEQTEIYSEPEEAHVHVTDGMHMYEAALPITAENGFMGHHNYVLEAKVWAMDEGEQEVVEELEFHVHPM